MKTEQIKVGKEIHLYAVNIEDMVSEHILQSYKEFYPTGSWKTVLEHGLGFSYKYHRLLRNFYRNCDWLYENLPSVGYQ